MKKALFLLLAMTTVMASLPDSQFKDGVAGNMAYAAVLSEDVKEKFAYDMAKITNDMLAVSDTNPEKFKARVAYAVERATAKALPFLPDSRSGMVTYNMAKFTQKILNDQQLDIEQAKAEFSYKMAQLEAEIIENPQPVTNYANPEGQSLLRNNAQAEDKQPAKKVVLPQPADKTANIDTQTFEALKQNFLKASEERKRNKINIAGEVDYGYAFQRGAAAGNRDTSGFSFGLNLNTALDDNWQANLLLERAKNLTYNDYNFELRPNVTGRLGQAKLTAGAFSYLMADGNIYDSCFHGIKLEAGKQIQYSVGFGLTDDGTYSTSKRMLIGTAQYNDFDYNLTAGIYHYTQESGAYTSDTIMTFGGKYNFNKLSASAMYVRSTQKDAKGVNHGYVLGLGYGNLNTGRPGTYDLFAKYYNQPLGTYVSPDMNGVGGLMEGFTGYGIGGQYMLGKNIVAGIGYYRLTDETTNNKGNTLWSGVNYFF